MAPRRPPDILRKSHAHSDGKARARGKRSLLDALDESFDELGRSRALLIDLDGVVYRGDSVIEGAAEVIRWLRSEQIPHLFLTNTTSRPREALVEKLLAFGIDIEIDQILSPADAACDWLAEKDCKRLLALVPAATAGAFANFDVIESSRDPGAPDQSVKVDAVVVGDLGRGWTFDLLNGAFRLLMNKPPPYLLALGMTRYWRSADGLMLDTAPFVVALSHASGVEPTVIGKPAAVFFELALARLGTTAAETTMIGDDIRVDIAGAQAAGLKGILVRTGKFRPEDLDLEIEPDLIIDSLADLPGICA